MSSDEVQTGHLPWTATYRLQLGPGFGFDQAAAVAPYLTDLGVSHVYLSPILQACPGSTHCYDVADPRELNPELGGRQGYERLCRELSRLGLGQLVDVVPNHMAAGGTNPWWRDVLRNGPASPYARFFDLRWQGTPPRIRLPVLGAQLEEVLQAGELRVEQSGGETVLRYHDQTFPLAPGTAPSPGQLPQLNRDVAALARLLEAQHYRLVRWQEAARAIDYRRFFDINGLVGLRVEDERVFYESHALLLGLIADGHIDGLRVDHVDGLRDPAAYLQRLRYAAPDVRIYVEKILESDEELPPWPVDGTTGYDFLNLVNGLFVDPAAESVLTALYAELSGETRPYEAVLIEKKRLVSERLFGGDLAYLHRLFQEACPESSSLPEDEVVMLLREALTALPVYRTYARPERGESSEADRRLIEKAIGAVASTRPDIRPSLVEALRDTLLLRSPGRGSEFVLAFQQLSAAVMAKGMEDTSFYCYNRLLSLNEVGGNPGRWGTSLGEFHARCARLAERWPRTMCATATHDTKRGEDTRLRIAALSELANEWLLLVRGWWQAHEPYLRDGLPDANTRYLLYQTLIGAWPLSEERAWEYLLKAAREAKQRTSWTEPDDGYEATLRLFLAALLADAAFRREITQFVARLDAIARVSSLSQTLIKLTAPGLPDFYQGTELWDLSLVDPDNRRPVDFEARRRLLQEAKRMTAREVTAEMRSGLPKLWLIWKVLSCRRQYPDLFESEYTPVFARGELADNVVAFMRSGRLLTVAPRLVERTRPGWQDTRLQVPAGKWRDLLTDDLLPGRDLAMDELLRDFPVALLLREEAG